MSSAGCRNSVGMAHSALVGLYKRHYLVVLRFEFTVQSTCVTRANKLQNTSGKLAIVDVRKVVLLARVAGGKRSPPTVQSTPLVAHTGMRSWR